jgi:two-component system chemotaxis response regulator CheB
MSPVRRTRVLIVDDSVIVRTMLANVLKSEPDMEVVGLAADPYAAFDLILQQKPDVLTLDIEMPRMDGLTFLRKLMAHRPLPVVIVSSVTQTGSAASIEALASGAIDVIAKPGGPYSVTDIADQLKYRIRALRSERAVRFTRFRQVASAQPAPISLDHAEGLILIGASTGGTQAIEGILKRLPADSPPILIAQHMPAHFTHAFAARLDSLCALRVVEARDGERLTRGVAHIAPGDSHLLVAGRGSDLRSVVEDGPRVHYQRPSVDVLFQSAAGLRGAADGDGIGRRRRHGGAAKCRRCDDCRRRTIVRRVRHAGRGDRSQRRHARGDALRNAQADCRCVSNRIPSAKSRFRIARSQCVRVS